MYIIWAKLIYKLFISALALGLTFVLIYSENIFPEPNTVAKASASLRRTKILLAFLLFMIANFIFLLFITRFTSVLIFTLAGIAGFSYFAYHSIRYLLHNRNAEHIVAMHYVWLHYKAHQAKQFEQAAAAAQKAFEHNCQWVPTWITAARFHEQYGFTSDQAKEFLEKANLLIKSNKDNSQNLEYLESYEDTFGTLEARQENLLEAIEHLKAAQQYKSNPNREQCIKKLESLLYPDEYKPDSDN